ncbi:MAG: ABC transporter ATP-binding protein [Acidimicrobiia bacterium]|nr:ABC transporter ATP-binding protein [Acidimicrobiia bacterium]
MTCSDATPAIELRNASKRYWKLEEQAMLLRSLLPFTRPKRSPIYALHDIDLTVGQGETLGIIGRNGAGKTTMLRLIAGVTQPSQGVVRTAGRVAPLISVGVGFHQEMSGRENVYVNGMLLGLSARQITQRFDDIVAFAELADFIDTPVKFYSSGMFMRLGFSVAVHSEPNLLVVDEVLAVGDMAFQAKCFERMRSLQREGTSIVMVSHSMGAIRVLCPRVAVMQNGRLVFDGDPETAIGEYYKVLSTSASGVASGPVVVVDRELRGAGGPDHYVDPDGEVELVTRLRFEQPVAGPSVLFQLRSEGGIAVSTTQSVLPAPKRIFAAGEEADVRVRFRARLAGGTYQLITIITGRDVDNHLLQDEGPIIYVGPRLGAWGFADPLATIEVDGEDWTWREPLTLDGRRPAEPRPPG